MDVNDDGDDDSDESLPVCLPAEKKISYKQIKSMIVVFSHQLSPIPDVTFRSLQCRVQPKNSISYFCNQHYIIAFQWVKLGWYRVKPLAQKRVVLNEVVRGFLHSLQKNTQLPYLKSGHARFFFSNSFFTNRPIIDAVQLELLEASLNALQQCENLHSSVRDVLTFWRRNYFFLF